VNHGSNWFAWFARPSGFDTLTQDVPHRRVRALQRPTIYANADDMTRHSPSSTPDSFARSGFARMDEAEAKGICERVFAEGPSAVTR